MRHDGEHCEIPRKLYLESSEWTTAGLTLRFVLGLLRGLSSTEGIDGTYECTVPKYYIQAP